MVSFVLVHRVFLLVHGVFVLVHRVFALVHGVFGLVHGVFVLVHRVFVLVHGVFVLVYRVFVLVHGVFVLVHRVFVLVHGVLGLRFWVFVLETLLFYKIRGPVFCRFRSVMVVVLLNASFSWEFVLGLALIVGINNSYSVKQQNPLGVACMTGALWAKRGKRDISRGARHERKARDEGERKYNLSRFELHSIRYRAWFLLYLHWSRVYKDSEIWVLRFRDRVLRFWDLGVFVFEFWVLRFRDRVLRFRDLGASCFGLRFRNYLGAAGTCKKQGLSFCRGSHFLPDHLIAVRE